MRLVQSNQMLHLKPSPSISIAVEISLSYKSYPQELSDKAHKIRERAAVNTLFSHKIIADEKLDPS